jgi:hypothetical protein
MSDDEALVRETRAMSSEAALERRVAAVEEAVAELRAQFASRPGHANWLEKVAGSISDEAAFDEALEYGRAFRQADRPPDDVEGEPL